MLSEAWARHGRASTFVEVPSYRNALGMLWRRAKPPEGVDVVCSWPVYPARWWSRVDESQLERAFARRAASLRRKLDTRMDLPSSSALVVSPVWTPWLRELPFGRVIYDCVDALDVHLPRPELAALFRRWEDELLDRASAAVTSASPLELELKERRPELESSVIQNGVDAAWFEKKARETARPPDLPDDRRPIVGFVGALFDWIDWRLIEEVTRRNPDYNFVFVGPGNRRASRLARLGNVRVLGARRYEEVPAYMEAFSVGWVPFSAGAIARAANPIKIYEYLALGKPVVSTPVADTGSFDGHVAVGNSAEEISDLLATAVRNPGKDREARMAFARRNSWDQRARAYLKLIDVL